jgi:alkylation response protein AidB-like acyl-CoA dehydrogenase
MTAPSFRPEESRLITAAQDFARDVVIPNAQSWERQRQMPRDIIAEAGSRGLCNLLVPTDQGGHGITFTAMAKIMEELSYADQAAAFALVVHNNFARSLAVFGSRYLHDKYLAKTCAGEFVGSFLLTEPQSGSDAANLLTIAEADGDDWIINGEKAWITNTDKADILAVYLQTDASASWRGIAAVLIDRETPGVEMVGPYEMLGGHAMGAGGFKFTNVRVPKNQTMIAAGEGFKAAMGGIDIARLIVASMCAGMLQCALDVAYPYAIKRHAFGQAIADFQGMQWQLADVATDLHAIRLMAYDAAGAIDRGDNVPLPAAHAKKFATRAALKGLAECMQAMGADGYRQEFPIARHLACAKAAQYLDGSTEIQNVVISRGLRKHYEG